MMMITITIIIVVAVAVVFHIFPHTYYRSKHLYLSSLPRRPSPKVQSSFTQLIGCCHQYGGCDKTSESSFMKKINNSCRTAEGIFKVSIKKNVFTIIICPDPSVKWLEVAGRAGLIWGFSKPTLSVKRECDVLKRRRSQNQTVTDLQSS